MSYFKELIIAVRIMYDMTGNDMTWKVISFSHTERSMEEGNDFRLECNPNPLVELFNFTLCS